MDAQAAALIAVVAVAPLAIVILVALLRGYTFEIRGSRDGFRHKKGDDEDNE